MAKQGTKKLRSVSIANAAATLICGANEGRLSVTIFNNTAGTVYLGVDNTVTGSSGATGGIPLAQNNSYTDSTSTDAWYARNDTGGAVDLRIIETEEGPS